MDDAAAEADAAAERRRLAALHEAAHAVVCVLVGGVVESATIDLDEGGPGRHGLVKCAIPRTAEGRFTPAILTVLAGWRAETDDARRRGDKMAEVNALYSSESDFEAAEKLFAAPDDEAGRRALDDAKAEADRILDGNRAALLDLAGELEIRGTLTGDEVHAIIARHSTKAEVA